MYKIKYHPRAIKFLKRISQKEVIKILNKIEILKENPFSIQLDNKKLVTTKNSYRLRIGKIRVIYEVDLENNLIYINDIDFRSNVY